MIDSKILNVKQGWELIDLDGKKEVCTTLGELDTVSFKVFG